MPKQDAKDLEGKATPSDGNGATPADRGSVVRMYAWVCLFRIVNALLMQSQFDPDEFWQNLEPAYCLAFLPGQGLECKGFTWEWTRQMPKQEGSGSVISWFVARARGPIRTHASMLITYGYYRLLRASGLDTPWAVSKGPSLVHAAFVAAPTDVAVWWLSADPSLGLFFSLTSWFHAYALVRTYSNSIETVLLATSMALTVPAFNSEKRTREQTFRIVLAFVLGGFSFAIRFSSAISWIIIGVRLAFAKSSSSFLSKISFILTMCATPAVVGIGLSVLIDRVFYGFWALPFLANIHFNVVEGNSSLYGMHPAHWYFTAGIPAISGLMLPLILYNCVTCHGEKNVFIWVLITCYTALHSISPHKEFRFLLPLLPLFCIVAAKSLRGLSRKGSNIDKKIRWAFMLNILPVLYLGLFHQRGSVDVNGAITNYIERDVQTYTVHYLMGCHSAPLLSHLHLPPVEFDTWALDCSPECRANPGTCESDLFLKDPGQFMEDSYFHCSDLEEGTCVTDLRIFYPDFIVVSTENLPEMTSRILAMGLVEIGRFPQSIVGASLFGGKIQLGETRPKVKKGKKEESLPQPGFPQNVIELNVKEIVLFADKKLKSKPLK